MAATKSALTSGMHHCFFRHGLIVLFFKCSRTVSYDRDSTNPSSTIRSANRRRFQWSWPSGAGLQAKAIRRPSARSSILRYRWAWGRSLSTPSSPALGKAPLDIEHRALGHVQGLGHPGRRPPLVGLEQDAGPD